MTDVAGTVPNIGIRVESKPPLLATFIAPSAGGEGNRQQPVPSLQLG
jgi:hypothetical protein